MRTLVAFVAALILAVTFAPRAHAQAPVAQQDGALVAVPETPAGEGLRWFLRQMDGDGPVEVEGRFAEAFLAQVPEAQMVAITSALRAQIGALAVEKIVAGSDTSMVAILYSERVDSYFALNIDVEEEAPHRFTGLLLQPAPRPAKGEDSWDKVEEDLSEVAAEVALGVYRVADDGSLRPVRMLNEQEPFAVGSTFKLFVLGALGESVARGERAWSDPLAIRKEWKSLPSGTMQTLPAGERRSLSQFADLMISISDNTATDHLLYTLGRETVEAFMAARCASAARNTPFLSTRELFVFKLAPESEAARRFIEGDAEQRRAVLAEIAGETPKLESAAGWETPRLVQEAEWFVSVEDLATLMHDLAQMSRAEGMWPLMAALSINPGIALDREAWPAFAYKGGSEPGVMNMTYWLQRADGAQYALSVTANDAEKAFEHAKVVAIAERAINLLAKE